MIFLDKTINIAVINMLGGEHERFLRVREEIRQLGKVPSDIKLNIFSSLACYVEVKDVLHGKMDKMVLLKTATLILTCCIVSIGQ
jgi:hypothetical protein